MWAKDGNGAGCGNGEDFAWKAAVRYCEGLTFANYSDWYLPTQKELLTIADDTVYNPAINKLFVNTKQDAYWSLTPDLNYYENGYVMSANVVDFADGSTGSVSSSGSESDFALYIRCVRRY